MKVRVIYLCDYLTWEERCKQEAYIFPVLKDCTTQDYQICRIYPLKQRAVYAIANYVREDDKINHVCIIGSAVSMKCTRESDIDIIVQLKESFNTLEVKNQVSERVQKLGEWNCDIIWYDHLDKTDEIYNEIYRGVFIK